MPASGWQPGLTRSVASLPLADVKAYNVYKAQLPAGFYTFWFVIFPQDGSTHYDTKSVYVVPQ